MSTIKGCLTTSSTIIIIIIYVLVLILITTTTTSRCYQLGNHSNSSPASITLLTTTTTSITGSNESASKKSPSEESEEQPPPPKALLMVIITVILLTLCSLLLGSACCEWCQCSGSILYSTAEQLPPTSSRSGSVARRCGGRSSPYAASPAVAARGQSMTPQGRLSLLAPSPLGSMNYSQGFKGNCLLQARKRSVSRLGKGKGGRRGKVVKSGKLLTLTSRV